MFPIVREWSIPWITLRLGKPVAQGICRIESLSSAVLSSGWKMPHILLPRHRGKTPHPLIFVLSLTSYPVSKLSVYRMHSLAVIFTTQDSRIRTLMATYPRPYLIKSVTGWKGSS